MLKLQHYQMITRELTQNYNQVNIRRLETERHIHAQFAFVIDGENARYWDSHRPVGKCVLQLKHLVVRGWTVFIKIFHQFISPDIHLFILKQELFKKLNA